MVEFSNLVFAGMLIFIVLIVSAPFLVSKWQAFFKRIGLCFSRNGLLSRSATILGLPAVEPNVAHRCLKTVLGEFRRAMMLFFTFFRSSKSETKTAIPLTSDSLLHVASLPGDNMPKSLSESPLIEEAITRPIVPYMGIPRRLRRQGWLLQLPFRRNSSVLEERIISPPPSVLSASLILRDVRNIRPEVNVNSADSSFFPEVVELSADDIEMPIIIPVAAPPHGLPIPIPVLELTATQSECNSPIPFGSPLGPSSLTLAQPNAFSCLSEDEICTVNICPENSGIQLSKESDNSSLCLLDRFPQPPNAAEGKACLITPAGLDERDDSAPELLSPIEKAAAGQDGERKTAQHSEVAVHIYAQERTVSANSRYGNRLMGSNDESMKTSQSEIIFRTDALPATWGEVQRSFSVPFGLMSPDWESKGLGYLQYHAGHVGLVHG